MSLFLDDKELAELTHRVRPRAQAAVLNAMGIQHKIRPDGSIAVLRSHVEKEFGITESRRKDDTFEPNWDAINA
jgi:hypothetical protein